jgi:hypothetical protein
MTVRRLTPTDWGDPRPMLQDLGTSHSPKRLHGPCIRNCWPIRSGRCSGTTRTPGWSARPLEPPESAGSGRRTRCQRRSDQSRRRSLSSSRSAGGTGRRRSARAATQASRLVNSRSGRPPAAGTGRDETRSSW